jgi:hypothetical protein
MDDPSSWTVASLKQFLDDCGVDVSACSIIACFRGKEAERMCGCGALGVG